MRRLVLLALVALAAFPLSAHDQWRDRRDFVTEDSCRVPYPRWEGRRFAQERWERQDHGRWERRGYDRHSDYDDARVILRPLPRHLAPPFQGRVEFWLR